MDIHIYRRLFNGSITGMKIATSKISDKRALVSYSIGFLSSIVLTLMAYGIVVYQVFSVWTAVLVISTLAFIQLIVQLVFFLHLGAESHPRWKLLTLLSTVFLLVIIVGGSIWIMFDLDSRMMMSPEDMIKYMNRQTGL